ncbi:hypothetical protein I5Q01_02690 [Serratia ureilytica]|uniref:hypothetical protein n=1 Tax=Serratia TaxID=613 RepID=UPI000D731DCF|nr:MULTISPECIES: hypothetical protein [Serratia]AWQ48037.1 hypothetical protein B1A42_12130 [Serratia marcescens]MBH3059282.1 hypothetical protein [Serratia ureilytica]MBN5267544.1 hypothetical protein [Serratia ureilytica]MBN5385951.1 hypothetical protein [Serratia ureilytica]MBN5443407.1 hypothetical protein [Serratia ureilytica]
MARKETFITIDAAGRDQGKVFYIKEMSASQAEWWALRALMAMGRGGVEIPDNLRSMGIAAMAVEGLKAISKIPPDEAKPLLDELMTCVQAVPNPADKTVVRPLIEADIDEVATRLHLRAEVFKLHVDFFATAGR